MSYNPKHLQTSIFAEIPNSDAIYAPVSSDPVREPAHYKFPGGVQVIDITQYLDFCSGNVVKYVARAGRKSSNVLQDLEKAQTYLNIRIEQVKAGLVKDYEENQARLREMGDEGVWGNA